MLHPILWIPTMKSLASEEPSLRLTQAFIDTGIEKGEFFYSLKRFSPNFSWNNLQKEGLILRVEEKRGFSFDTLCFQGCHDAKVSYTTADGNLWYPVHLQAIEKYHPDELAIYFKECWKEIHPQSRPARVFR